VRLVVVMAVLMAVLLVKLALQIQALAVVAVDTQEAVAIITLEELAALAS
jgi:hypothetical protein